MIIIITVINNCSNLIYNFSGSYSLQLVGNLELSFANFIKKTKFDKDIKKSRFPTICQFDEPLYWTMLYICYLQIGLPQGLKMLCIFKEYEPEASLLDDFEFYEEKHRQKLAKKNSAVRCSEDNLMVLPFVLAEYPHFDILYSEKFGFYWFWLNLGPYLMNHKE